MSLEKREVFPNRFRYVCGTCSFNWPRTPLPSDELPPAPKHSCPNAAVPATVPVVGAAVGAAPVVVSTSVSTKLEPAKTGEAVEAPVVSKIETLIVSTSETPAVPQIEDATVGKIEAPVVSGNEAPVISKTETLSVPKTEAPEAVSGRSLNLPIPVAAPEPQKPLPEAPSKPPEKAAPPKEAPAPKKPAKDRVAKAPLAKPAPAVAAQSPAVIKRKPVAVCTRCGAVSYDVPQINGRCANEIAGKRCVGVNGSALHPDDWKLCQKCSGTGNLDGGPCGTCNAAGWLYTRDPRGR